MCLIMPLKDHSQENKVSSSSIYEFFKEFILIHTNKTILDLKMPKMVIIGHSKLIPVSLDKLTEKKGSE